MNSNIKKPLKEKKRKNNFDFSTFFKYKVTRNMLHWTGDTGGFNSTSWGTSVLFGNPPEEYWPSINKKSKEVFDREPSAFSYALSQNFKTTNCLRLDTGENSREQLLILIKNCILNKRPVNFTFNVFESMKQTCRDGKVPFPCEGEKLHGKHSLNALGYDDNLQIKNDNCDYTTTGALLIMNSWGIKWGNNGSGWLPYDYVLKRFMNECWILLDMEMVNINQFKP